MTNRSVYRISYASDVGSSAVFFQRLSISRFMISCDQCDEWFHGVCVNVTKNQGKAYAKKNLPWYCPRCRKTVSSAKLPAGTETSAHSVPKSKTSSDKKESGTSKTPLKGIDKNLKSIVKVPPTRQAGELKEFIQRQKSSEAKNSKKTATEEKPPVEADITGLVKT